MSNELAPVLIAGPTASGKSALALALAEALGGVIINADSMQVYRELEILTARPQPAELARAPHALYGFVHAAEAYSVGRFLADAEAALIDAGARGLRPIFVGGTGLYFKALLEGLSPIPTIDEAVRRKWRAEAELRGAEALHATLTQKDPVMAARLAPTDTQRIVRALEVIDSSGRSLADWQEMRGYPVVDEARAKCLVVDPGRDVLHARADARFERMIERGALAEAAQLADLQLDPELPAMRAIGVVPLIAAARGEIDTAAATAAAKSDTRQYIKRQQTWLKRNMITWKLIQQQEIERSVAETVTFIQS